MNGQLTVLLCLGAMLAMVTPSLSSPVRTDASGRLVITHSKVSGKKMAHGSEVSSGSGSGGDFDFDGEGPWTDDEDTDCVNSTTTKPEVTKEPEGTTESEPEGSGASTDQPDGSGEEAEATSEAAVTTERTTAETATETHKPKKFKCPTTFKNGNYLFPDPDDCNAFYQCDTYGVSWEKKCPQGLAFHNDYQVCVYPKTYGLC